MEVTQRDEPEPVEFSGMSPEEMLALRESAKTKLVQGQTLSEEEAAVLVGL